MIWLWLRSLFMVVVVVVVIGNGHWAWLWWLCLPVVYIVEQDRLRRPDHPLALSTMPHTGRRTKGQQTKEKEEERKWARVHNDDEEARIEGKKRDFRVSDDCDTRMMLSSHLVESGGIISTHEEFGDCHAFEVRLTTTEDDRGGAGGVGHLTQSKEVRG